MSASDNITGIGEESGGTANNKLQSPKANRKMRITKSRLKGYFWVAVALTPFFVFFVVVPTLWFVNNTFTGTMTCTVSSADLLSSSSGRGGSTPSRVLVIQTQDCGEIRVNKMKSPKRMNVAALEEFLNAHQGEKFEFITQFFPGAGGVTRSFGISSTDPVK